MIKRTKDNIFNTKSFLKLIIYNLVIFAAFSISGLLILEILLKNKNPYSLFPKEMTSKKGIKIKEKYFSYYDGAKNISRYESKTNVTYKHNNMGFRVNKEFSNPKYKYQLSNSVISFGDSTAYGLNIENKFSFSNLISQKINKKNAYNFSYPGMNLDSISYKVKCTNQVLKNRKQKAKLILISLYYNDLENLDNIEFLNPNSCKDIKEINLTNAPITNTNRNKYKNIDLIERTYDKQYWISKIKNPKKYPLYLELLLCRKIFSRTCPIIKFSIANLSPKLKSFIFGSHETQGLRTSISSNDLKILEKSILNFKNGIIEISKNTDFLFIFYIPRHELDLINSEKKGNRERIFYLYEEICKEKNKNSNLVCFDGTKVILSTLNEADKENLIKNKRLPNKYYSFLPTYDMGHPSKYLSKIYSDNFLVEYQKLISNQIP